MKVKRTLIYKNKEKKTIIKRIIVILLLIFLVYLERNVLIYRPLLEFFPRKTIKGVVIPEKKYYKGSQFTGFFSYYYQFEINGKSYKNPTYDSLYNVGDSVLIEYNKYFPLMNRIK